VRSRKPCGFDYLLFGGVGLSVCDVLTHAAREKINVLLNYADVIAQRFLGYTFYVQAVKQYLSVVDLVKAGDKITVNYTSATISGRTGAANSLTVAYTEVTGGPNAPQTDANYADEIIVLSSVIALLGAVILIAGVFSKKALKAN
jgi:hypothetical protein